MESRPEAMARYLAVWNGEEGIDALDEVLSDEYHGHLGSRDRTASDLRADIAAYRERVPGVRFRIEHQFGDGGYIATRVTATATDPANGEQKSVAGINISRWVDGRLAEEWAVWEAFETAG